MTGCAICNGDGAIHAHLWVMPFRGECYFRPMRSESDAPPHMRHLLTVDAGGSVMKKCLVCDGTGLSPRARAESARR